MKNKIDYTKLTDKEILSITAYEILRLSDHPVSSISEYKDRIDKLDVSDAVKDYLKSICDNLKENN